MGSTRVKDLEVPPFHKPADKAKSRPLTRTLSPSGGEGEFISRFVVTMRPERLESIDRQLLRSSPKMLGKAVPSRQKPSDWSRQTDSARRRSSARILCTSL